MRLGAPSRGIFSEKPPDPHPEHLLAPSIGVCRAVMQLPALPGACPASGMGLSPGKTTQDASIGVGNGAGGDTKPVPRGHGVTVDLQAPAGS